MTKMVKDERLDARKMLKDLLDLCRRMVPQANINALLKTKRGAFYENLKALEIQYNMPLKFKNNLITKRLEQQGLLGKLAQWRRLLKRKRAITRQSLGEEISERQTKVKGTLNEIDIKIDNLLSGV